MPSSLKFEPGEVMKFNGTALPNKTIKIVLKDPLGKEIFASVFQIDNSGFLEFEFPTTQSTLKGTYTLIATQGEEKEFIFAGIGQLPTIPVYFEFDKLSYKAGETAIISLTGKGSDIVNLLIIDPSDKQKGDIIKITLEPDGRGSYFLNLDGFSSGVYSAVVSKGTVSSEEIFAVDLQSACGVIEIYTTKDNYLQGESILILGKTERKCLAEFTLIDPDEKISLTKVTIVRLTVTDKDGGTSGKISEESFSIPSDAKQGIWTIKVKSGANFAEKKIEVLGTLVEGIQVSVGDETKIPGIGTSVLIKVTGASQTVHIEITAEDGDVIDDSLKCIATSSGGNCEIPWIIPTGTEPGTISIKVNDAFDSAETTFELKY